MARRLVDISVPLQNDVAADPPGLGPTIEYIDHQHSLPQILPFFPGLKREDLPDGQGWAVERVQLSTHNGTHLDAPWHYHPTMNEGERLDNRRDPARMVLPARREARFPSFRRRLCRDRSRRRGRARAHRP
jgi:kynurenine formamidase